MQTGALADERIGSGGPELPRRAENHEGEERQRHELRGGEHHSRRRIAPCCTGSFPRTRATRSW